MDTLFRKAVSPYLPTVRADITRICAWVYQSDCAEMNDGCCVCTTDERVFRFFGASDFFAQPEHCLNALVVLDYSTSPREAYVVIPNRGSVQLYRGLVNYHICCTNPCDGLVRDIEEVVQASKEECLNLDMSFRT